MFREQQIIVKKHNKKLQNQNNNVNRKKKKGKMSLEWNMSNIWLLQRYLLH
jgi:hypothetical protein